MTHQWDTHEDRNNGFFYYGNVICNLWPTFLLLNFSSFIVRVDNSRQHVTVKIMFLRTVQSIAFHWPRWSRNLSRWRSLTGTVAHQGSNLSLPLCLSLPPPPPLQHRCNSPPSYTACPRGCTSGCCGAESLAVAPVASGRCPAGGTWRRPRKRR